MSLLASILPSAVSGIFGLGSSAMNLKAQKSANDTNMRIAQMNNEWSEKMMDKQNLLNIEQWKREAQFSQQQIKNANAFTEYMQNKANEFNSSSAQAQRYREAGLNPALMMSGSNAGVASGASGALGSTPSGNSVGLPSPSSATVQPLRYDGFMNAISNSIQMALAIDKHTSEMDALGRSTAADVALARAKIAQMYEQTRGEKFKNELNDITKDLQVGMTNESFLKTINERYLIEQQEKLIKQQTLAQELINENLPDKLSQELAVMASTVDLNKHNAQHEVGKLIETLKKRGYKLSKAQENAIFEAVISKVENEANIIGSPWQLIGNGISAVKRIKTKTSN